MKRLCLFIAATFIACNAYAQNTQLKIKINGNKFDIEQSHTLSDLGEGHTDINFDFRSKNGKPYNFDLKYKKLPSNRSYPGNLDLTIKDGNNQKLGYLFFANNGIKFLKQMAVLGIVIDINGEPVDIKLIFDEQKPGNLRVAQLENERLIQDTLVPKLGFQMIRPVIVPLAREGVRSQTYKLDAHPFAVNYTLLDIENGRVQFQYNLYRTENKQNKLLERIYFNADRLETLREGMFAGKYFDEQVGTFKLVFYPAMGQTEPGS